MSERERPGDEQIDRWVLDSLDRSAEHVNADRLLAGIHGRLERKRRLALLRRWSLRGAIAASLAIAIFWGWTLWPQPVSAEITAEKLVQQVLQQEREQPLDRCYAVTYQDDKGQLDRDMLVPMQPQARLWTRGDRFWMESAKRPTIGTWGRDETGQVWVAPLPQFGVRFAHDKIPAPIKSACDLFSMDVPTLLSDVLANFELERETTAEEPVQTVRAQLKGGQEQKTLRTVRLQIDTRKSIAQRLESTRSYKNATITTTFELVETRAQPDERYRLEGHLKKGARVLSGDLKALQRFEELRKLFSGQRKESTKKG